MRHKLTICGLWQPPVGGGFPQPSAHLVRGGWRERCGQACDDPGGVDRHPTPRLARAQGGIRFRLRQEEAHRQTLQPQGYSAHYCQEPAQVITSISFAVIHMTTHHSFRFCHHFKTVEIYSRFVAAAGVTELTKEEFDQFNLWTKATLFHDSNIGTTIYSTKATTPRIL